MKMTDSDSVPITQDTIYSVSDKKALHIGCGSHKMPGAIGLDITPMPGVDVVLELGREKLPFPDDTFDIVYAHHVLEHITPLSDVLAELHRVCKAGAIIDVIVPYYTCVGAFGDPTHVRFFTYRTFEHFADTEDKERYTWFSGTRFRIGPRHIGFGRLFRLLLIEFLANRLPNIYENFFAFTFPARTLWVQLIVNKQPENPPEPNSKLRAAFENYKRDVSSQPLNPPAEF